MRAGDLRRRVTIQQRSAPADALGQPVQAWEDVATVWADVAPLSGRELVSARAVNAELTHTVTIRYQGLFGNPLAMAKMRVLYGARVFNIQGSVDPDERHKSLELSCSEGLIDG